jgi:anaerobic selenocysteine-containing dehydrogenase
MYKQKESEFGISEYDLAAYLCKEFDIELQSEAEYLSHFESFALKNTEGVGMVKGREITPYSDGFDTDDGEFVFLEEFEQLKNDDKGFHLITPKSPKSLNSQFSRNDSVYLHSALGYEAGESVKISSKFGNVSLKVQINDDLREDSVLIYSGTRGVNNLTSSKHSYDGKCAIFQEEKVEINKL